MHHFVYPSQDTFISNVSGYEDLNFGLNEILRVGVPLVTTRTILSTKSYPISESVSNFCVSNFSGSILGATLYGTASVISAFISNITVQSNVTTSYFSIGTLTGSYWSGSISSSNFTGSLTDFSGSFTGYFDGIISGSFLSDYIEYFTGAVSDFDGKIINGYLSGVQVLNQQHSVVVEKAYSNRALLQFDLTAISSSIASGDIVNPRFTLKMKTAREENMPIRYSLYAYPLLENWNMGDGYYFDGGSSIGASWNFRDYYSGSSWSVTGSTYSSNPNASQIFDYEAGDISMDVTNIVNAWLTGSLTNNGLVVLSGEETNPTGSGMSLYFFSQDTNTIYSPHLDVGWEDFSIISGSITTSSVNMSTIGGGMTSSIQSGSTFIIPAGGINGMFSADAFLTRIEGDISGMVVGVGETGTINGLSIIGNILGTSSLITYPVTGSCGEQFDAYNITASFTTGIFSGSSFQAHYTNYKIVDAFLTGSWTDFAVLGNVITIPIPSGIDPFAYAYVSGPYLHGKALGQYILSGSNSASFSGQFVDGNYVGGVLNLQLVGDIYTSSYSYTSSMTMETNELDPLQVSNPFVVVVSLPEKVKNNQIIKVKVSGREQFPLKNFQRLPQFSQFLTPLYLPSSSFYAIKDNETEEIILDFDNYTRLSCDTNGNYFMLDTSGLPQERYFKVLIKVEQSGSIYVVDNNNIFKVVR